MGATTGGSVRGCDLKHGSIFLARVVFALLFALVTWLTVTPNPDDTEAGFKVVRWIASVLFGDPERGDKVAHFAAYGVLGASAVFAKFSLFGKRLWIPLGLAAYGAMLEGVQGLGGVRTPEAVDAIANALGAVAGFGLAYMVTQLFYGKKA